MFNQVFYHDTIRKYVILFGTIFNDVYINKSDGTNTTQTIKVPISYGPKQKFIARLSQDPNLTKPVAIQLPRIGFELTDLVYAADRKLLTTNRISVANPDDPDKMKYQYMPVPYDLRFSLYILVKNSEDGTRILEQILPFFTPDWTPSINLDPSMNHKYDIPIILSSVKSEDTYEGNFIDRRVLTWTLDFTMKGYIFGPTKTRSLIKNSIINLYDIGNGEDFDIAIGNTQFQDVVNSIPVVAGKTLGEIQPTDNYTINTTITQFYDQ